MSRGGLYAHGVRTEWLVVVVVCAGLALGSCDNETQPGSRQTSSPATPTASQSVTPPPVESSSAERDACEVVALRMPELRDGELGVWTGLSEFAAGGGGSDDTARTLLLGLAVEVADAAMDAPTIGPQLNVLKGAIAEATDSDFIMDDESVAVGVAMTGFLLACYDERIIEPSAEDSSEAEKQVDWLAFGVPVRKIFCAELRSSFWSGVPRTIQEITSDPGQQRGVAAMYAAYAIYSCPQMIRRAVTISEEVNS